MVFGINSTCKAIKIILGSELFYFNCVSRTINLEVTRAIMYSYYRDLHFFVVKLFSFPAASPKIFYSNNYSYEKCSELIIRT